MKPEILKLPGDDDGSGFLLAFLMESIYLNCDDKMMRYALPRPYQYANFKWQKFHPDEISPTAKYVLRPNLATIEKLDQELLDHGIDIFNLTGIVKIDEQNCICPPILEVWEKEPFSGKPAVTDGAHRLYIARKRNQEVNCIAISGNISSDLPMLPLSGWDQVHEQDKVPIDKRDYHPGIKHLNWKAHELYRQKIPGSTGPRLPST